MVTGPDGSRYEVIGTAKEWKLGTGSVLLDVAAFLWALVRQARDKEWVVVLRRVGTDNDPIVTHAYRTREHAASGATELAEAVERGDFAPSDD